jgi:hypothetical protein
MCDKDIYVSGIVDQKENSLTRIAVELKNEMNLFLKDKQTGLSDVNRIHYKIKEQPGQVTMLERKLHQLKVQTTTKTTSGTTTRA